MGKFISILSKHSASSAQYMHMVKHFIGRGSPLGNDWSHLSASKAKYRVKSVEEAVQCHRAAFIAMLRDYKNVAYRDQLCYIRRIFDSYIADNDIALVCYCRTEVQGQPIKGHGCHAQVIKELLEILAEDYSTKGFSYCVERLAAQ